MHTHILLFSLVHTYTHSQAHVSHVYKYTYTLAHCTATLLWTLWLTRHNL